MHTRNRTLSIPPSTVPRWRRIVRPSHLLPRLPTLQSPASQPQQVLAVMSASGGDAVTITYVDRDRQRTLAPSTGRMPWKLASTSEQVPRDSLVSMVFPLPCASDQICPPPSMFSLIGALSKLSPNICWGSILSNYIGFRSLGMRNQIRLIIEGQQVDFLHRLNCNAFWAGSHHHSGEISCDYLLHILSRAICVSLHWTDHITISLLT